MLKENFFLGIPAEIKKNLFVYPPLIKEMVSNQNFQIYAKLLTITQEEIEDEMMKKDKTTKEFPTPYNDMLQKCESNQGYENLYKEAFYFFLHQKVNFLYNLRLIVIGDMEEVVKNLNNINDLIYICEKDFFAFQNVIRQAIGEKEIELPNPNEHPRIREMKRKARYRDMVKAKQNAKTGEGISFFIALVSICCMGLGITPLNVGEMSYCALKSIFNRYQFKEKYELDIESLLAGADSKKVHPKYWIKNLDD